jgi:endoglycosylceramidase
VTIVAYLPPGRLAASVPAAPYPASDPALPWLHAEAGRIADAQDRTVLLRGFNVDALVSYPKNPPAPFDETDAGLIQQSGFDVVRLGIDWAQLEPKRGRIDEGYLDRVAAMVGLINRHGLYVVLDMHFRLGWSPRFGYSGAPGWATLGLPDWNPFPQYSWSPSLSPAAFGSDTYFWLSNDWKPEFYRSWQAVAARFVNNSGVAGYDIFNEAHPLPIPPKIFDKSYLWPMFKDAIEAIGRVDAHHLFFVEGILLLTMDTVVVPLQAPNLVYGTHLYEGSLVPPYWNGDPSFLRQRIQQRVKEAAQVPAPLWVGELGYDLTRPGALGYADAALDEMDARGVGWAWWQWRENRYWGIVDAAGAMVNRDALRHLARPYLMAAPAGVKAGGGDGINGTISFDVAASHADQPLLVGWPALTLAAPAASGPCLLSAEYDATTARLVLRLDAGGGCRITVRASNG